MDDSSQCEDTKQQEMEKNAVYEVRATRSAYTSKTRSKEVRSARKGSKASSSFSNQLRTQYARR